MLKQSLLIIGFSLLIGFLSCEKENSYIIKNSEFSYDVQSRIPYSSIKTKPKGFIGKFGSEKILVFKDMGTFIFTLKELERQILELDSAFVAYFNYLDDESLNIKEDEIGFRMETPLIDFSDYLDYRSLFVKIDEEEKLWLQSEELDFMNDPDNHFIFEEELRTLLNVDCEVQIGKIIYKFTEEGWYEVYNEDLKSLSEIDNNPEMYKYLKNVSFFGEIDDKSTDCKTNKAKSDSEASGNYKIKWRVAHITRPWERYVKAKTTNYKKNTVLGITYWAKYRTGCSARVYGHISDSEGDCSEKVEFNNSTGQYAYNKKAKWVKHICYVQTKTSSGWVKGDHLGAGGIQKSSVLTW